MYSYLFGFKRLRCLSKEVALIRIRQSMEREREDPRHLNGFGMLLFRTNLLDRWWCRKPKFGLPSLPSLALPSVGDCTCGPELVPYSYVHMTCTYVAGLHLWLLAPRILRCFREPNKMAEARADGFALTAVTGY